jgi:hypothetical protein
MVYTREGRRFMNAYIHDCFVIFIAGYISVAKSWTKVLYLIWYLFKVFYLKVGVHKVRLYI